MCSAFATMTRPFTIIIHRTLSYLASKSCDLTLKLDSAPEPSSSACSGSEQGPVNAVRPASPSPSVAPAPPVQAATSPESPLPPGGASAEIPPVTLPIGVVLSSAGSGSSVVVTTGPTVPAPIAEQQATPDDGLSLEERRTRLTRVPDFLVAPPRPILPKSS
jgi:hypothetical protein